MSDRAAVAEAAKWVVRLQEPSANADTFVEWQRWLAEAPEHRAAFDEMEETLLLLTRIEAKPNLPSVAELTSDTYDGSVPVAEFLANREVPAGASETAGRKANAVSRKGNAPATTARLRYAIAAGLFGVTVLGGWLSFEALVGSTQGDFAYSTAPGERKAFTLPDGSRITLDADSALNVELSRGERSLRLARGEAYFEVAKDPSRPFIVNAGGARALAVGTEFNVRMAHHRTVVAVVEGIVQVAARSDTTHSATVPQTDLGEQHSQVVARVTAGEAVAYAADGGLQTLPADEASLATTWLGGRRQYRNEPLQYVLADVDRYTGRQIQVADAATGALKFTGTLNLENSDAWLKALSIALPVSVTQQPDGSLLVTLRAPAPQPVRSKTAAA